MLYLKAVPKSDRHKQWGKRRPAECRAQLRTMAEPVDMCAIRKQKKRKSSSRWKKRRGGSEEPRKTARPSYVEVMQHEHAAIYIAKEKSAAMLQLATPT